VIREVYVDGYRSLEALKIPIRQGLNVLVGPNGGGKTNILSFFELLSRLSETAVDEAVSSHGGIGRVFTRLPDDKYRNSLSCAVRGSTGFAMKNGEAKTLWYTWQFEIVASENYDEISYGDQTLYINVQREPTRPEYSDLILGLKKDEYGTSLEIKTLVISRLQHLFRGLPFVNVGTYLSYNQAARILRTYARYADLTKESLFSGFPPQMTLFHQIKRDVSGGQIFNFVPEICKQPEDSARPPIMDKSGAGLASVLHRLGKDKPLPLDVPRRRRNPFQSDTYKLRKISSYVDLISPSVCGLKTEKNHIDNTISVFVIISEEQGDVAFPLAQCSDGTVKWIALLTKIVTASAGFSIEEPENFLHPAVQKEFLNIVRTEFKSNSHSPFTMVTTHSESLLNEASPSEVILVWMNSGKTVAQRVSNAEELVDEINRTGFGLGYYFASGALEGA
jgi:predicted ATPase